MTSLSGWSKSYMVLSVLKDAEGHHLKALCRELRGKDRAEDTVI